MRLGLPKLYAITDVRLTNLSHAAQVARLVAGGVRLVQLREKRMSPREFYADAARAVEIAKHHNTTIIINDRLDIALAVGADGVHLGQTDLDVEAARAVVRKIRNEDFIIGYSTHTVEQAIDAVRLPVDYLAAGPVCDTTTKENPDAVIGIEGVRAVRAAIDKLKPGMPLVAIGGIRLETARGAVDAGANCVAVISDLWRDANRVEARVQAMLARLS